MHEIPHLGLIPDRLRLVPGLPGSVYQGLSSAGDEMKNSRIREPSSWGSLGAMVIGIGLMAPVNQSLILLGIACCIAGIVLREKK